MSNFGSWLITSSPLYERPNRSWRPNDEARHSGEVSTAVRPAFQSTLVVGCRAPPCAGSEPPTTGRGCAKGENESEQRASDDTEVVSPQRWLGGPAPFRIIALEAREPELEPGQASWPLGGPGCAATPRSPNQAGGTPPAAPRCAGRARRRPRRRPGSRPGRPRRRGRGDGGPGHPTS